MKNLIMELLTLGLFFTLLFKAKFVVPLKELNKDYLSIKSTNMLKGFFAIVVLFHHLALWTSAGIIFRQFKLVGYLAVSIFFFFSGYGLQKKYMTDENYSKQFLSRRIPTVLIPYIIITVIYWSAYALQGKMYSLIDIILKLRRGYPIAENSWYIINILIFYFIFWVLMRTCKKHYAAMIIGACVYYVAWIFICRALSFGGWWYNTVHLLIIGMLWAYGEKKINTTITKHYFIISPIVLILLFASLISGIFVDKMQNEIIVLLTKIISAMLFVFTIILFTMKFRIGNGILNFLGNISFEIYMIQGLWMLTLNGNYINNHKNPLLWSCAVIICTIISSYFLHKLFRFVLAKYKALLPQAK